MENNKEKLQVAVIGLGKMGLLHSSLLNVFSNVDLVAICDKSRLMRSMASRTLKGTLVTDNFDPLVDLNLDAVYVTTPIPSHFSIVKEIYSKKIARNLFVEKTLSSNANKSAELAELSRITKSVNMVGYMKRFSVTFKKAKDLVEEEKLGQLISFEGYAFSSDFASVKDDPSVSISRGGVLVDLGAHVVDLALWFFEELNVTSASIKSITGPNAVDSVDFQTQNQNNINGSFNISWIKEGYRMPEFGLKITGTKGTLTVDDSRVKLETPHSNPTEWYRQDLLDNVPFLLAEPEYYRENETFIKSLVNKTETSPNFATALKVDKLLAEVERKAHEQ